MPFIPHTPAELKEMLNFIGVNNLEDLFAEIPQTLRPKSFNLPNGLSEMETMDKFTELASKNDIQLSSFLGGGFYNRYIPHIIDTLSGRGEFLTSYTPYQPEASQGTLQAIFEYQSVIARLFELDYANASVYDGGTALFEAAMMAVRASKKTRLVIDSSVNPLYRQMLQTLTANLELELVTVEHSNGEPNLEALAKAVNDKTAALIVQNPNFFGVISDFSELFAVNKKQGGYNIIASDPIMQSILKTPGEMKADIAVAEGQSLGLPLSFGGPYLGIMACTKDLIRQMPGRIVGRTSDTDGRTGYVLTLQAREQHIRRAKATSNICSNQALCALRAVIYICLNGSEGLERTALNSMQNMRLVEEKLLKIKGIKRLNQAPYANEVAFVLPKDAEAVYNTLAKEKCLPGLAVKRWYKNMDNVLLVCATEKTTAKDIELLSRLLTECLK
ncbi:aminomethyl-transferring glycine dehydrogenase subunit GcvPA [Desulfovibrio litoralis]|uniref:Probable glycine dehydrogenase (decarboxylating) subunit 1 n=1 Tax=Desulfovibrio litoralis DSM 11393 TaxID=1121455 RepID=A0A1M7TK99_9BACT|nr:aminomethyl-transferring glycine dehydrogenase subunit GcvPA [Desulfovibrio litoralis]SHN71126.1 glycine dehydrogenase (decarboxylating) alpha subunit [Desulfovibrio litoralis DSM 11393]